ncbi:hypothetical protein ORI89_17295 [Sphingobacterium sp. UT-1RO-CII-1]|uniref:hypothetical protein n=1 Tax=Sphingobacterium sp. UT-1RO-CII-1 TaxID=2995225 RepID=UPI00227CDD75|nr:hypothetical protein [Sphingobacterium sp. UT-1RO-CII-1]MCY4781418.1 hypothetical protein [Sphingobacterium sp. UT-1RO-CII-1]
MSVFKEKHLINLGFVRHEWNDDEFGKIVDHKFENADVTIEITNLSTVELTTRGQYVSLSMINSSKKLKQLINLLTN